MNNEDNVIQYPNSIETRVALLEMSIININNTLIRIENELKDIRSEIKEVRNEIKEVRRDLKYDTRWLLTIITALGGVMAHGFHWF
jgi:uncharacterized protein (UPF0335 family)